jgi:Zn-dependent alcohol dehydrogenase
VPLRSSPQHRRTPMTGSRVLGGREGADVITQLGPDVEGLAVGDHVVLSFVPSCGDRHATFGSWASTLCLGFTLARAEVNIVLSEISGT